jgi:PAS domain S-box-containing protein
MTTRPMPSSQASILVVDDQPANLQLLTQMLHEQGYRVRVARDGPQALASARSDPPDLILLDIMMPGMNGYTILEVLKANPRTRECRVIFISALQEVYEKVRAFGSGGVDYITKPFQAEEVLARVETHLTLRRMQRQLQEQNARLTQEIIDRQYAEEAYRNLVQYSLQGLIIVQEGRIIFANPAIEMIYGYRVAEMLAMPADQVMQLVHPDDRQEVQHRMAEHLAAGTHAFGNEHRIIRKDGQVRWVAVYGALVEFRGTAVFQLAIIDITDRKRAEADLQQQQQALTMLRERERLARELHDTVGQVIGYVQTQTQAIRDLLAAGKLDLTNQALEQLALVTHETNADVRTFILGVQTGGSPEYGFFASVERYLERYEQIYGVRASLTIAPELAEHAFAPVVEAHLVRIIQEALSNVRKHAEASAVRVDFEAHADQMQLVIADDGRGFASAPIATDSGHHFGLRSMRDRVSEIDGSIRIDSHPGRGTRVVVHVPLAALNMPRVEGLRLLLVDDQPLFLEGLQNMLAARGVSVVGTAANGAEAQAQARLLQPDVILMDVDMPVCNGLEATRRIKAEFPEIQIVMLSVSTDDQNLFEAIKSGASGYLLKNLEVGDFFALLARLERGEVALSPVMAQKMLQEFARFNNADATVAATAPDRPTERELAAGEHLTDLQREVLALVAQGHPYRIVGERVGYSERSVKKIMSEIIQQLHMQNRAAVIAYARKIGLDTDRA